MDDRIYEHARLLVDHSTQIEAGETVIIQAPSPADDLVAALYELLGERGAIPFALTGSNRFKRAFLMHAEEDSLALTRHLLAAVEETDAFISIRGDLNTFEESDVSPEKLTAYGRVQQPLLEERLQTRWVTTQHPAPGAAQAAEMSTDTYADFVYDAITKDWEQQRIFQQQLVDILNEGSSLHLVSGDETDLRMRIEEMIALNDGATHNLPGGEVFTAPISDSVEGTVLFDKPLIIQGREVLDAYLEFEDGEVVAHDASKNVDLLSAILETDPGARRLGEVGFGMNRDIDRFTYNMLFDEKMGDTVHLAIGRAYKENVPDESMRNSSAIHEDMIVDMAEDSYVEVDGERIQQDGTFRFEADW